MLIAGDIGGTTADLAMYSKESGPHAPLAEVEVHSCRVFLAIFRWCGCRSGRPCPRWGNRCRGKKTVVGPLTKPPRRQAHETQCMLHRDSAGHDDRRWNDGSTTRSWPAQRWRECA